MAKSRGGARKAAAGVVQANGMGSAAQDGGDGEAKAPLAAAESDSVGGGGERRVDKFGFLMDEGDGPAQEAPLEDVPLEVLRQRESKWLDMLNNWDKWMAKKHKKIDTADIRVEQHPSSHHPCF